MLMNRSQAFLKYKLRRSLEEIRKDILALEEEAGGMIKEIIE